MSLQYRVKMPNGITYQIPVAAIARHRADALIAAGTPQEDAIARAAQEFGDRDHIAAYARQNMRWSDVAPHAAVAAIDVPDFEAAWTNGAPVITTLDERAEIGVAELRTIPVLEMFRHMERTGEACVVTTFTDDQGQPAALMALVQGGPSVVAYRLAIEQASAQIEAVSSAEMEEPAQLAE